MVPKAGVPVREGQGSLGAQGLCASHGSQCLACKGRGPEVEGNCCSLTEVTGEPTENQTKKCVRFQSVYSCKPNIAVSLKP